MKYLRQATQSFKMAQQFLLGGKAADPKPCDSTAYVVQGRVRQAVFAMKVCCNRIIMTKGTCSSATSAS